MRHIVDQRAHRCVWAGWVPFFYFDEDAELLHYLIKVCDCEILTHAESFGFRVIREVPVIGVTTFLMSRLAR